MSYADFKWVLFNNAVTSGTVFAYALIHAFTHQTFTTAIVGAIWGGIFGLAVTLARAGYAIEVQS